MTEAELQKAVIELAQRLDWRVAHFRTALSQSGRWLTPVQGDGAGFPDLLMLRHGHLIVAELKSERGRLSAEQDDWLAAFLIAGATVCVWKPKDWLSGEIEATLRNGIPGVPLEKFLQTV